MTNLKKQAIELKIEVEQLKWSDVSMRHVYKTFIKQVEFNNILLEKISTLEKEIENLKRNNTNHE